jgi:hypothetical protein
VREIQTKSGRESRHTRPAIARQHSNKSSDEAHIWHTIRRQKTNLRGVLVVLLLMKQISVAFSNHPAEVPGSVDPSLLRTEII